MCSPAHTSPRSPPQAGEVSGPAGACRAVSLTVAGRSPEPPASSAPLPRKQEVLLF